MATNTENEDKLDILSQEKEDYKQVAAARMAKLSEERPEAGLLSKGEWWVPAIDFNFDVKGRLPHENNEKLNDCLRRIIDQKYAPEVVGPALDEARGYLAGEEDLLAQFNKVFSSKFWDTMYKHGLEKEEKSTGGECSL